MEGMRTTPFHPRTLTGQAMANAQVECEECHQPLKIGDEIAHTVDLKVERVRYWHKACFDASLTPFEQWPKNVGQK
jgi:hypothetical protein